MNKMTNLQIFRNSEFGEVRTVTIDSEPWFVGKDVAAALGYQNVSRDINNHVEESDRKVLSNQNYQNGTLEIPNRGLTIINESGLYALIFGSKLESAKRFKHWVTSEVLPAIRKNGGYIQGQESMNDDELLAKALMVAQNKIAEKQKRIDEMKPHAILGRAITTANTTILVGDMAKIQE